LPLRTVVSTNDWWRHATDTNDFEATRKYLIPDGRSHIALSLSCFGNRWQLGIQRDTVAYKPVTYADYYGPGGGSVVEAFAGDLNSDGNTDVVMVECNGGACGLAADRTDNLLLLSDGVGGFRLLEFETFGISTNDFAVLSGNGPASVMISQHLMAKAGDGKTHSYWVFAPYEVAGPNLAPLKTANWPLWIWYTIRPNHEPTSHFTRSEKDRLWEDHNRDYRVVREIALERGDGTTSGSTVRAAERP
jgi:hypothetical protein